MSSVTLSSRRLQSPLAESSAHKSGGSTQLLQPQRLNNPLLSQEDMNIIKRDEDTRSIPVGPLRVTLNTRATGSPDHHVFFTRLHGSEPAPVASLTTDSVQLSFLLSSLLAQNGFALATVSPATSWKLFPCLSQHHCHYHSVPFHKERGHRFS